MPTGKSRIFPRTAKVLVIVATIIGVGMFVYGSYRNGKVSGGSSHVKTVNIRLQPYTSKQDKFVVDFAGTPSVKHQVIPVDGVTVQQNNYENRLPNSQVVFYVTATSYPLSYITDSMSALESAATGEVRNMKGAKAIANNSGTYQGYPALDTTYSVPQGKTTFLVSSRNLLSGNVLYTVLVFHGTPDNFTKFANSFHVSQ